MTKKGSKQLHPMFFSCPAKSSWKVWHSLACSQLQWELLCLSFTTQGGFSPLWIGLGVRSTRLMKCTVGLIGGSLLGGYLLWLTWPSGVSICLDFCCLFIFQKFLGCITLVTKTDQGQGRLLNVLIEYHVVFFWCVMSWTIIYCWLLYDIFIVTVFACVDIYPLLCGIFCCCCYYNVLLLHKRSHLERGTNRGKGGESRD